MRLVEWIDTEVCWHVIRTLGHFLCQGAAVGVAVMILARLLSKRTARLRYAAHLGALIVMAICPLVTYYVMAPHDTIGTWPQVQETFFDGPQESIRQGPRPVIQDGRATRMAPADTALPLTATNVPDQPLDWHRLCAPHGGHLPGERHDDADSSADRPAPSIQPG